MSKLIRFAALIRVSSEKQEKEGESLRTQRTDIDAVVPQLGGRVAGWYGGQEHATPGWEKKEIDRLLADAREGKYDAVIVTNADRWSRDNGKSREGLDVFRQHRVRFFVGATEYDLFNPEHVLFLGMSAVIGQFQAAHQNRKSIHNRIARAKRGWPACGKLPHGRTFDRATGQWGIDPEEQARIEEIARRYLAGESLADLAKEYGRNHPHLHKVLTRQCGDSWEQTFDSDDLNIHETITTRIPRLLPEETVRAILERARANKTYAHGHKKYPYLFARMVFCGHCRYAMSGQYVATNRRRYYRHTYADRQRPCDAPRGWADADELERVVMRHLFETLGNPLAMQRAVEQATPDAGKVEEARGELEQVARELERVQAERGRVVRMVARGLLTDEHVADEMAKIGEREARLQDRSARLLATLQHIPEPEAVKSRAKRIAEGWFERRMAARYEDMTWEDKRGLVQLVFGGKTSDGGRMGVYLTRSDEPGRGRWRYTVLGHLVEADGFFPASDDRAEGFAAGHPYRQREALELVTNSPWRTPTAARWPRRSPGCTAARASRRTAPAAGRAGG